MTTHVVLFRWQPGTPPEAVAALGAALDAMVPLVPTIRSYRHGPDLGVGDGNWDYALVATFEDTDGFRAYRDHPAHVAVVEEHVRPILAEVARVQF